MPHRTKAARVYAVIGRMLLNMRHALAEVYPDMDIEDRLICFGVVIGITENRPLTISSLSAYTGVPRTTTLRKVQRLIDAGYLEYNEERAVVARKDKLVGTLPLELSEKCSRMVLHAAAELSEMDN